MSLFKKILIFNIILFFFVLAFLVYTIFKFNAFLNTKASSAHKGVYILIKKNEPVPTIIKKLKNNGIITRGDWFYYYLRLSGVAGKIKAGYHLFFKDFTPKQVLDELINPKVKTIKITVLPGYNLEKIEQLLKQKKFNYLGFKRISKDKNFIKRCTGYNASTLEGFLYPDTYLVGLKDKPQSLARLMCNRFKKAFKKITRKDNFTDSDYKKLIVASIIQKEATNENDMRLVASVIYNRLKKDMPLQMDSTKGIDNKSYNTYLHKGLPPTPICNPSESAIKAAYEPEKSDFLFFISKKDGSMVFSETLKQHDKNIRKYLK